MPDTPFKSMSRETPQNFRQSKGKGEPCERCGLLVYPGDWPFCTPGNPQDHIR